MKFRSILVLSFLLLGLATAATAGAGAPRDSSDEGGAGSGDDGPTLSVSSWTHGLFGTLDGSKDCAADRRVVVFEQDGDGRDPSRDRQAEVTRTADGDEAGEWSIRGSVGDPGRYYAVAPATDDCAAASSDLIRPDLRDDSGPSSRVSVICGTWEPREKFPKQYGECFYAARVTTASCDGQHLDTNPYGDCSDPAGIPCFCQSSFKWRLPERGQTTIVETSATINPFDGITAESRGEPRALYATDVKAGSYANIYPPQGEPGKAGGPLLLSESKDGRTVQLEGILYQK